MKRELTNTAAVLVLLFAVPMALAARVDGYYWHALALGVVTVAMLWTLRRNNWPPT